MPPMLALPFPQIDPVLVAFGPIAIRWYALAYIAGILIGWRIMIRLAANPVQDPRGPGPDRAAVDDFLLWAVAGIILGGRLGYVVFYNPAHFLSNPAEILAIWRGGMAFHGGLLGVIVAAILFARRRGIGLLPLADLLALVAPIGLFFGRIANFINGELYGRVSDVPWAMIFPHGGPDPRHPSQLYQAALEGLLLFLLLLALARFAEARKTPGLLTGVFLAGYGVARGIGELFREPDPQIGFLLGGITMGQLLSLPLILAGLALIVWCRRATHPPKG